MLKSLSNVLTRLGQYQQKKALHYWYDTALKPLRVKYQNEDMAMLVNCNNLQAKVFYGWLAYH